ncbi:MAG TPA: sensor histidine kinase [Terriglobia bacterium]|nr:sensor histidine kinase [Terriglobia bacterium]
MVPSADVPPSSPPRQVGDIATDEKPPRGPRASLLIAFGGLLAIMVAAGLNALQTLRELHRAEEVARSQYLTQTQVLATVTYLARISDGTVERYVLSVDSAASAGPRDQITRQAEQAHTALRNYPASPDPEEQALLKDMEEQLTEEERTVQAIFSLRPEERRRRGADLVSQELIPRRLKIQEMSQRIEDSSRQRLNEGMLQEFGALQTRLTHMILLALVTGLLLATASAFYILRLERQAQQRYRDLARSRHDLERLSAQLVDAQETERKSLSRELHDEVGQSLGALLVDVGRLTNLLPSESPPMQEHLGRIKAAAENAVRTVRNMALLLRPSMLDDLGLVPALEWQGREVSRRTEMEVEVQSENVPENLPDEYKICIYRVVQEALNNAARHAESRTARVRVIQDNQKIEVSIVDHGRGFDPRRVRGLGLVGMEERVKRLGGSLTLESRPGEGTTVKAELPRPAPTSS